MQAYDAKTKDHYAAFNKPGAVLDFMSKGVPMADYMLVIDSDMQLRHPFRPDKYNMTKGKAISADYTYMIGCTNELATRHIPEIPLRNDTLAGPLHRRCDMVSDPQGCSGTCITIAHSRQRLQSFLDPSTKIALKARSLAPLH